MSNSAQSISAFHAKYFAWELSRKRSSSEEDRLCQSLFDASVDLKLWDPQGELTIIARPHRSARNANDFIQERDPNTPRRSPGTYTSASSAGTYKPCQMVRSLSR